MNIFKNLINAIKASIEQDEAQTRLNSLIGKKKKQDYIKVKIPKDYIPMIEVLAIYGINDNVQLLNILNTTYSKPINSVNSEL
jgi:hypothetical protein